MDSVVIDSPGLVDTHRAAFPVYLFAFAASASAPV
jgi:hypothetical protein